jgi:hypothetical protein
MSNTLTIIEKLYAECQKVKINTKVPTINRGGCGIFAEVLYHKLIKLGLKPILGVITYKSFEGDTDRLVDMKYQINNVRHVVVIVGKKLIDSEGIYNDVIDTKYDKPKLIKNIPIEKLMEWNKDRGLWNPRFKANHTRIVKNLLNIVYKNLVELN